MDLNIGVALPNTINVIAYAEVENVTEIDRNRNVIFDYGNWKWMLQKSINCYVEGVEKLFSESTLSIVYLGDYPLEDRYY